MRKYLFIISGIILSTYAEAQLNETEWADSSHFISLGGDFGYQSTAFTVEMAEKFFYGGHISDEMINNAASKQSALNQLAVLGSLNLNYRSPIGKKVLNSFNYWGVETGTTVFSYNQYTDDLFNLVFQGNNDYFGSTAELSDAQMQTQWFHQLIFTIGSKDYIEDDLVQFELKPKFLIGIQQQQLSISQGQLNFSTLGDEIEVATQAEFSQHDSLYSAGKFGAFGAGVDLIGKYKRGNSTLSLSIQNMASYIAWKQQSSYTIDTTLTYSGIEVEDIFSIEDSLASFQEILDSLNKESGSKNNWLPTTFAAHLNHQFAASFSGDVFVSLTSVSRYIPFLTLRANYHKQGFTCGISGSYGGFAGLQIGTHLSYVSDKLFAKLGTMNLPGFFLKDQQYSQSIYASIGFKFK